MIRRLEIDEFLKEAEGHLLLDVRSEGEFEYGHIPQAVNMPLFNNEERKIVGTLYKQQGREEAIVRGREIAEKKIPGFLQFVANNKKNEQVFVHCWRGGMRSEGVAGVLDGHGYKVTVLEDGYKAYRHHVLDILARDYRLMVLGGKTGSGKTEVLHSLRQSGEQVVDLEELAKHKGSAFGALGQASQPSTEHFENLLAEELKNFDRQKPVWVEDESRTIGRVFLDLQFWNHMSSAPLFVIDISVEMRIANLVDGYGHFSANDLKEAVSKIQKRLGNEQWKHAVEKIHTGALKDAVKIMLVYYDKAYEKAIAMKEERQITRFAFENERPDEIAVVLIKESRRKYGA